jgi:hypothetical protein
MPQARRSSKRSGRSSSGNLGHVKKAEEQAKKRAAARDRKWLKMEDGDEVIVRLFPSEEFWKDGYVHRVPMELKGGKKIYADIMCLDQDEEGVPCPGCKDEIQRRFKFWTPVIVRDWEGDDGKVADVVMIWSSGITIAKRLDKMLGKHDLAKRDIVVARSGSTKDDTEYDIDWEDEEDIPYSASDKKLLEQAPDLTRYTRIPEYDDFYTPLDERDSDGKSDGEQSLKRNPFSKKKSSSNDDDGEDPKKRRRSVRSSSSSKSSSKKPTIRRRRG